MKKDPESFHNYCKINVKHRIFKYCIKIFSFPPLAGYVLCDFPSLSEDFMSIPEQIDVIKNLNLKPDFLINIKVSTGGSPSLPPSPGAGRDRTPSPCWISCS